MIDINHKDMSVRRQCRLLGVNRSTLYYTPQQENETTLVLMRLIDEEYLKHPFYRSRKMMFVLERLGYKVSRHRVRRLMHKMGIMAIYQKPKTSIPNPNHKIYPYLLKNLDIYRPNQVWAADITYLPMKKGFMYLVAIIDWYSRKVLSWKPSNTLDQEFCCEALRDAIDRYGKPEIFNTDQGSQFTSTAFTDMLKEHTIQISMDSKGRWMDNVMVERLWRSVKYECVYLQEFDTVSQLNDAPAYMAFYNDERPHATFAGRTPSNVYNNFVLIKTKLAA